MNVLEYIEETPRLRLGNTVTVNRTIGGKYLFYHLVRHYRREFRKSPTFITYSKAEVGHAKGLIEEVSVFGGSALFVLEGFTSNFVAGLTPPDGVHVLAEVDGGLLETPVFSFKVRRLAIKSIASHLGIKIPMRDLLALDWGGVRDYAEIEIILRRAEMAGWGVSEIGDVLSTSSSGNILLDLKKGNVADLIALSTKYGEGWFFRNMIKLIPQITVYKSLSLMGQSNSNIAEVLGVSNTRLRELEEAAKALSPQDLKVLAERVLSLDGMFFRRPTLATSLIILKSGISVRR
jgi:hypothetical protein